MTVIGVKEIAAIDGTSLGGDTVQLKTKSSKFLPITIGTRRTKQPMSTLFRLQNLTRLQTLLHCSDNNLKHIAAAVSTVFGRFFNR